MPGPPARLPSLDRFRSTARLTAAASGAVLVAFHGGLFAAQALNGRLDDPWLVVRWLIAAGLIATLAAIGRARGSIWTRQGLAVWVLAAMLHGPAVANEFRHSPVSLALPEASVISIVESLVSVTAFAAALWMLAGLLRRCRRHTRLYARAYADRLRAGIFGDGFSPRYFSRPPPHLG